MSKKAEEITFNKDMTVGEVVGLYPGAADILMGYGLHCVGCHANAYETVEQGVMGHGYSEEDLKNLVEDINEGYQDEQEGVEKKPVPKEADDMEIEITEKAQAQIEKISKEEKKDGMPLRIDAQSAGPKLRYSLNFVTAKETTVNDKGFSFGKIKVVIDKKLYKKLNGLEIDYVKEEKRAGFKMNNPNVPS
jgi:iron-sulfur cluster assembly protein